jgi:hypothetical protein
VLYSEYNKNKHNEERINEFPSVLGTEDSGEERIEYLKKVASFLINLGSDGSPIRVYGNEKAVKMQGQHAAFDLEKNKDDAMSSFIEWNGVLKRDVELVENELGLLIYKITCTVRKGKTVKFLTPGIDLKAYVEALNNGKDTQEKKQTDTIEDARYSVYIPGNTISVSAVTSSEGFNWHRNGEDLCGLDEETLINWLKQMGKTKGVVKWDEVIYRNVTELSVGKFEELQIGLFYGVDEAHEILKYDFDTGKVQGALFSDGGKAIVEIYVPNCEYKQCFRFFKSEDGVVRYQYSEASKEDILDNSGTVSKKEK